MNLGASRVESGFVADEDRCRPIRGGAKAHSAGTADTNTNIDTDFASDTNTDTDTDIATDTDTDTDTNTDFADRRGVPS